MEFLRHRLQRHELLRDFAWHYDLKDSTIHQEFLRSSCKKYHDDPQTIIGLFLFGALVVLPSTLLNLYYELPQLTLIKTLLLSVLHVSAAIVWLIGNVKRFQSIRTHINPSSLSSSENIPEVSNKWSTKTCSTTPSTSSSSINTQYRHASYDDKYGLALWFAFILPFIGNILTQHKHFHLIICNGMSSCVTNGLILLILPVWLFITNQLPHIRNIFSVIAITGIIFSWAVIKLGNYEILPFIWFGVILYFNLIVELQIMKYQEFITMRCLQNTITTMEQRFQTQSSKDVKKAVQKLVQEMHLVSLFIRF